MADVQQHDMKELKNKDFFDYQAEQAHAVAQGSFADDVKEQMDNLTWATHVIFQCILLSGIVQCVFLIEVDSPSVLVLHSCHS